MSIRSLLALLLISGCSTPTQTTSTSPEPATSQATTSAPGQVSAPQAQATPPQRDITAQLKECAAFRVNTEDGQGDVPKACRGLADQRQELTQQCQASAQGPACYAAGLLTLGDVPTTVGFSLRVPPGNSWASTTLMLHQRLTPDGDRDNASALLAKGCMAGHHGSCEMLLLAGLPAQEVGFPRAILGTLCAQGASPGACARWVYEVMATRGMQTEDDAQFTQATRTLLRERCEQDGFRSCNNLGVAQIMWGNTSGQSYVARGCVASTGDPRLDGRSAACANLVSLRLHRKKFRRTKADYATATSVLADACSRGDDASCLYHALAQRAGVGIKKNRRAAKAALGDLCRKGIMDACRYK